MPDFDPPLKMAFESLTEPARQLTTRHVIIISDGDPGMPTPATLAAFNNLKVTISTVAVGAHGGAGSDTLSKIAKETLGNASHYMEIFNANRDQLESPDQIKPGQVLSIPQHADR